MSIKTLQGRADRSGTVLSLLKVELRPLSWTAKYLHGWGLHGRGEPVQFGSHGKVCGHDRLVVSLPSPSAYTTPDIACPRRGKANVR